MLGWLCKFFADPEFFRQHVSGLGSAIEPYKTPLKGALITLALAIGSGQINLGPKMWWAAPFIAGVQSLIQKNPDLGKIVASATPRQIVALNLASPMPPTKE